MKLFGWGLTGLHNYEFILSNKCMRVRGHNFNKGLNFDHFGPAPRASISLRVMKFTIRVLLTPKMYHL